LFFLGGAILDGEWHDVIFQNCQLLSEASQAPAIGELNLVETMPLDGQNLSMLEVA
jgi:hypothetical protein